MAYKVTYFDIQGKGEPIRYILSYGGVDFEDIRVPKEDWPALKPDTPFGQLPVLEHNGKSSHQTVAICRYLAKQFKLAGNNDWEDLEIDAAVDTISDLFQKIISGVHGSSGAETFADQFKKDDVLFFLKKIDEQIKRNKGYVAVGRLTWADLFFASFSVQFLHHSGNNNLFDDYPSIEENMKKVQNLPKIREWISKHPETK